MFLMFLMFHIYFYSRRNQGLVPDAPLDTKPRGRAVNRAQWFSVYGVSGAERQRDHCNVTWASGR